MQVFLPYEDYQRSAEVLDNKRLGKQRVETYQVLLQLRGLAPTGDPAHPFAARPARWHHPAMAMWSGHEGALLEYQRATCTEWILRGFRDTCLDKTIMLLSALPLEAEAYRPPAWLGDEEFHLSHRSNLLRKDPAHYGPLFPGTPDSLPYRWPAGRVPLRERCQEAYQEAASLLGTLEAFREGEEARGGVPQEGGAFSELPPPPRMHP